MAKPQKENGFAPIANEILDALCQYTFNGAQLRIVLKIWRLTYGYGRKDHDFSITFLQQTTGISGRTVKKEIAFLIKSKVLLVTKSETKTTARRLAFNKNYDEWTITKSGDFMEEQIEMFSTDEGSNTSPPYDEGGGEQYFPSEGSNTSPQVASGRGAILPPYKEIKILKKSIKENIERFDEFYQKYPRKVSKDAAKKAWEKLCKLKGFEPDTAIQNTANFAETCKLLQTEKQFIPHPSTFLNQKRYKDYPVVDPEGMLKPAETSKKTGSVLDRALQREVEGIGSSRRDITPEVPVGSLPELCD
ncbi:replication protein [Paenibacillus sp. S150]|uniref:replication protein n=1 Tax=Paenibacillus sp. S150 TaxID=2749826 RepID=UPI001C562717|nr:replication protein [Paenibacillus sp. S150]MBW4083585.1 replication protein [Paenibacillus sp. S150]